MCMVTVCHCVASCMCIQLEYGHYGDSVSLCSLMATVAHDDSVSLYMALY